MKQLNDYAAESRYTEDAAGRVWVGTVDGLVSYAKGTLDRPRDQLTLTDLPLLAMHAETRRRRNAGR